VTPEYPPPIEITALPDDAMTRYYVQVKSPDDLRRLQIWWAEPIFDAGLYLILFHDGRIFATQKAAP